MVVAAVALLLVAETWKRQCWLAALEVVKRVCF
jgi:hypothetical protein